MRKFKLWKTVDCVVGGLYRKRGTQAVEHLLLGPHDEEGLLNYVGRARIYEDAAEIGRLLEPLVGGTGFTIRAPGGKSRWSGRERVPVPLKPVLVVQRRSHHRRAHAPRRAPVALANRQITGKLHDGSDQVIKAGDLELEPNMTSSNGHTADRQAAAHRAGFPAFTDITTRWMDNDVYGHVNNVVYYSFLDTAINEFLIDRNFLEPHNGELIGFVVDTGCQYFRPIAFPDRVAAGIRVAHLGKSSVRYEVGISGTRRRLRQHKGTSSMSTSTEAPTYLSRPFPNPSVKRSGLLVSDNGGTSLVS